MGLHLSSDSSPVPNLTRKLSTPPAPRVSVGISPIRAQHTPLRMLVSRGCSPVPMISLLPPDIAAFFNSTQMQLTQDSESSVALPVHLGVSDVISVTSSESDNEATQNPSSSRVPRDRPGDSGSELFHKDFLVRLCLSVCIFLTHVSSRPQRWEKRAS
jgi:hypothetical protein